LLSNETERFSQTSEKKWVLLKKRRAFTFYMDKSPNRTN
jgi:hypothetical protein